MSESVEEFRDRARREYDAANASPPEPTAGDVKDAKLRQHLRDTADELYEFLAFTPALPETLLLQTINAQKAAHHNRSDLAAVESMVGEITATIREFRDSQDREFRDMRHKTRIDLPELPSAEPERDANGKFVPSKFLDNDAQNADILDRSRVVPMSPLVVEPALPYDEPADAAIARLNRAHPAPGAAKQ